MPIRVIVLDYDGTLVDSNGLKRDAYRPLFPPGPPYDEWLADALERFPAGPRRAVLRAVLERSPSASCLDGALDADVERLAERYDRVASEGAASCAERPGASAVLAALSHRLPLYLLSTTPEESLRRVVERRGWTGYFRAVRGSPCRKADEIRAFAAAEGVLCRDVLMVGDSETDRAAAAEAGAAYLMMTDGMNADAVLSRAVEESSDA